MNIPEIQDYILRRLDIVFHRVGEPVPIQSLSYELDGVDFLMVEKAIENLVKSGCVLAVNMKDNFVLFLTRVKYPNILTSKLKKPCKDCPYRIGQSENFAMLLTDTKDYDGSIVHDCHALSDDYKLKGDGLGCIGSAYFGMKVNDILKNDELKDIDEMIYPNM